MPRHLRPVFLLCIAALIAGCGGSSTPAAPESPERIQPRSASGAVNVGVTGGGIGDATRGDRGGIRILPDAKVPGRSNTEQGVGAGATCDGVDLAPAQDNLPAVAGATLCLLNGERADAGLGPLKENAKLASAAMRHSRDMVDRQYFDHTGRDGSDPVDRIRATGYIPVVGSWMVGENLAWGTGVLATPKEIVAAWMRSQGHRQNILRVEFREIGFGVVLGNPRSTSGSGATYTTAFGGTEPLTAAPARKRKARRVTKGRRARVSRKRRARAARRGVRARVSKGSTRGKG